MQWCWKCCTLLDLDRQTQVKAEGTPSICSAVCMLRKDTLWPEVPALSALSRHKSDKGIDLFMKLSLKWVLPAQDHDCDCFHDVYLQHTSSVVMGDPVKIVEKETTHDVSFNWPTARRSAAFLLHWRISRSLHPIQRDVKQQQENMGL